MRTLLLLSLLTPCVLPFQTTIVSDEASPVTVSSYKWSRSRQVIARPDDAPIAPAEAMTVHDKNFERNKRINASPAERDPNADTLDRRRADMDRIVQESRAPQPKTVRGFEYKVKVKNMASKVAEVVFLEYQFIESATPAKVTRRQFLCGVNIKPTKEHELQAYSALGPSDVISVASLAKANEVFKEKAVINRVEYADGTIWQRKGWNFAEIRLTLARALNTPWGAEMCRSL